MSDFTLGVIGRLKAKVNINETIIRPCPTAGKIAAILLQGFFQNLYGIFLMNSLRMKLKMASDIPATIRNPRALESECVNEKLSLKIWAAKEYPRSAKIIDIKKPKKSAKITQNPTLQASLT